MFFCRYLLAEMRQFGIEDCRISGSSGVAFKTARKL